MRRTLKALLIYTVITLLVYFGEVEEIPYAYNVGIVMVWFFILVSFASLLVPPEGLFKRIQYKELVRLAQASMIIFIISVGWHWSGVSYLIAVLSLYTKEMLYLETLECEDD